MKRCVLILAVLAALSFSASASTVFWTLSGVTFDDGGTASGSFGFDNDTTTYSNVNITTTLGTTLGGTSYGFVCVSPCTGLTPDNQDVLFLTEASTNNLNGTFALALTFNSALTDAGGTSTLSGQLEGTCNDATCDNATTPSRNILTGSVFVAPEPSSLLLIVSGTALLFGASRQRRRA